MLITIPGLAPEEYPPAGKEFLQAYEAEYGEEPSYHGAGGYAAGLILQRAIELADSYETEAVTAALDQAAKR